MSGPAPAPPGKISCGVEAQDFHACVSKLGKAARTALVAPGGGINTLRQPALSYVYLDCGKWAGTSDDMHPRRDFGVVWGRWVLLCEFVPEAGETETVAPDARPLNELLRALCGEDGSVRVRSKAWSRSHVEPPHDTVYVFVPDLHLPLIVGEPQRITAPNGREVCLPLEASWGLSGEPSKSMGRGFYSLTGWTPFSDPSEYVDRDRDDGTFQTPFGYFLSDPAAEWYRLNAANNIFQGAGGDLISFLRRLKGASGAVPVHLVHLGDMFEMWNGFDRFFALHKEHRVELIGQGDVTGEEFVRYWLKRAKKTWADLLGAFHEFGPKQTTYLHGNHDSYLRAFTGGEVPSRTPELRRPGIFVEHGQRTDSWNRDGTPGGYRIANVNFRQENQLRDLEQKLDNSEWGKKFRNARRDHVIGASASFAGAVLGERPDGTAGSSPDGDGRSFGPEFAVYVMGHTHEAKLAHVTLRDARTKGTGKDAEDRETIY